MFAEANDYERFMGRWSRLVAPQLVDFTDVPDLGRLLDVGSGTGALAFTLAERKPQAQVRGIDPSKEYVEYAKSKNPFQIGSASRPAMHNSCVLPMRALTPVSLCWYSISSPIPSKP